MADKSKIEWTDATWNPVTGCAKVSDGCRNCYADRMHNRFSSVPFTKVVLHHDRLDNPLHWRKPRAVFVCSMSDLFQPSVPLEFIAAVFTTMAQARQHTFIVLTKRPDRMFTVIAGWQVCGLTLREGHGAVLPNVVLGVSVENQKAADDRIPHLLKTPAARRVVSYEPALGPVVFRGLSGLSGIICGGESGPGARPMHPRWVKSARDQCAEADVAFFFKQWGEWAPAWRAGEALAECQQAGSRQFPAGCAVHKWPCGELSWRIGKKAAGRLLDGRTHDDLPWTLHNTTPRDGGETVGDT